VIAALIPLIINVAITVQVGPLRPEYLGLGASVGLFCGFAALFAMAHASRRRWLAQG
jgi:1,4-dihydroxy-2-naphthoate octaprenyltransferase